MNKVPDSLRKSLYEYIDESEEEIVDNLLKQGFPKTNESEDEETENNIDR